ncbi:lipoprotein [Borreliella chilensis]|uniref:Lipoprotein n=1 Tax=Borreliella chilensis TaxID=1245910 RepID=A0A0A7UVG8_9SPIR|nr:lipoprotein [Borreliella chilensis]
MNLLFGIANFFLILLLFVSCKQKQSEIQNLTYLLKSSNKNGLDRFLIIDRVVNIYIANKNHEDALKIVNSGIINDESREYYPLYLYLMGNIYCSMGEDFVAFSIYKNIVDNFGDYVYENYSVKTRVAKKIINLNIDSIDKIDYYKFILNKEIDNLNNEEKGNYFYNLALGLEDIQDYDESYFYYKKFLSIPRSYLKIDSRDYFNVVTKINYFNNPDFVVYRNLGDLIQDVKNFVLSGNTTKLLNIRDKNNFFIQSWDQKGGKSNSINTNSFLTTMIRLGGRRKNGIQFANHLEADSSDDISYLESSGWDHIREWYFVFKRIAYPKDPEINNGWTWIGVYLGKK